MGEKYCESGLEVSLAVTSIVREGRRELAALAAMPDKAIDMSDSPEVLNWKGARRGLFYRPVKRQLTLRLDVDLVEWFKRSAGNGRGYQTDINSALREYVLRREKKRRAAG